MDANRLPGFSIALACCNGEAHLQALLASLLGQQRLPAEIVASDEASTDASVAIIERFAGTIVGLSGCANHLYAGAPRGTTGMMGRACLTQNLSAVTAACMVLRKGVFDEVEGFDELHLPVSFNDVDFCLKVLERGYRNLWTPYAELYHHESASRGPEDTPEKYLRSQDEIAYIRSRWPQLVDNDPAYNPNLTLDYSWPYPAETPRVRKPWQTH